MPYIPISPEDEKKMLAAIGAAEVSEFFDAVPPSVRLKEGLHLPPGMSEPRLRRHFNLLSRNNQTITGRPCFLGAGVYAHEVPACVKAVVTRPEFVTSYTPYQPEIAQGTLKSLFDYQTYLCELTGLEVSNSSLYDGASAVAEAVCMGLRVKRGSGPVLLSRGLHPDYRGTVKTYLDPRDIPVLEIPLKGTETDLAALVASVHANSVVVVQQPNFLGTVEDLASLAAACKAKGAFLVVAVTEAMDLALLPTPGSLGADAVAGSGQAFGNPLSFGGPHVGFLTVKMADIRQMPGRVVGITTDRLGHTAYALTFQAREQHIRREKASSNVCTTQSLMAHFASCWLYFKGGKGARAAAQQAVATTHALVRELGAIPGYRIETTRYANEIVIRPPKAGFADFLADWGIVAPYDLSAEYPEYKDCVLAACTELTTVEDLEAFVSASAEFAGKTRPAPVTSLPVEIPNWIPQAPEPRIPAHSEVETVRYYTGLARMNYGVDDGFYPLGSCTMKYNPKINEEIALSPEWTELHPNQREEEVQGALQVLWETEKWLSEVTGCAGVTLQPAAGAHGELTALMIAKKYFKDRGEAGRMNVIVPESAHGTNPASAAMAGFNVVSIPLDARGNTDLAALKSKVGKDTAVLMLTNPSTLGLFEEQIVELAALVHEAGALLYYDGANMNAILGVCRPADMGFDLVHLNLHKSFSTPHGGGGPGSGPVGVSERLVPYLPEPRVMHEGNRYFLKSGSPQSIGRVKANTGQFGVVLRAYAYCLRLGKEGLERVGRFATLNANYMLARLKGAYPVAYDRRCMHEFVLGVEPLKKQFGLSALDLAKRLIDYGYHPPTIYFPLVVHEAVMIEPTETETLASMDAFIDAMLKIREEMERTPEIFKTAPHKTPVSRLDEVKAVKEPRLTACL